MNLYAYYAYNVVMYVEPIGYTQKKLACPIGERPLDENQMKEGLGNKREKTKKPVRR